MVIISMAERVVTKQRHSRERHLAASADVVTHEIARACQQLKERVGKGTGVHAPKQRYVILDGAPSHTSHLGTLTAARTIVVGKLGAAVMTMLYGVRMAIDMVRLCLLPLAETVVFLY